MPRGWTCIFSDASYFAFDILIRWACAFFWVDKLLGDIGFKMEFLTLPHFKMNESYGHGLMQFPWLGKFEEESNSFSHLSNFIQCVQPCTVCNGGGHLQSVLGDTSWGNTPSLCPMRHKQRSEENESYSPTQLFAWYLLSASLHLDGKRNQSTVNI